MNPNDVLEESLQKVVPKEFSPLERICLAKIYERWAAQLRKSAEVASNATPSKRKKKKQTAADKLKASLEWRNRK